MHLDRLGALLGGIVVASVQPAAQPGACLWVEQQGGAMAVGLGFPCPPGVLVSARLQWPGAEVLLQSGPFLMGLAPDAALYGVANLLLAEVQTPRCGAASLLTGYAEVLLVHMLRDAIGGNGPGPGLLGGLADPKLARSLVAIHEKPSLDWSADLLAAEAGMSRSAFMVRFRDVVGQTPMAYLRQWRLNRAAEALNRGDRVTDVARRFGYRSADAFSRAFHSQHGRGPSEWRRGQAA